MNRKKFLLNSAAGATALLIHPFQSFSKDYSDIEPYKTELVKEFVVAGHGAKEGDFDKVKSMLNDYPNMVFSKYDWGNGDFESAIEGAGHLGKKEIAEYLIDAGSRVTLFVLCMLGKTNLVKPVLEEYPKLVFAKGPHGFTMLHHAKIGGKNSEALFEYLQEKGLKETWIKIK
ncbi:MAG: hypothetical protein ABIN97_21060 [Ginsengibacter sp.]